MIAIHHCHSLHLRPSRSHDQSFIRELLIELVVPLAIIKLPEKTEATRSIGDIVLCILHCLIAINIINACKTSIFVSLEWPSVIGILESLDDA